MNAPKDAWRILLPAGAVELALLATLAWWPGAWDGSLRWPLFGGAFAAYAMAGVWIKDARGGGWLVWGVALALRCALLPADPVLSGEVFRHLWDGRLQLEGINPFAVAPSDPSLAGLRAAFPFPLDEFASPTSFAPVTLAASALISLIGGTVVQAKLLALGLDLATGWLLGRIAFFSGRSRRLTQLLYLWSPLLVVEVAWHGKLVSVTLFLLALVVLLGRARLASGVAAGLTFMALPPSLATLPPLVRRQGWRFLAGSLAAMLVALLPYAGAGLGMVAALATPWLAGRSFEGPFLLIESVLPSGAARVLVAALVLAVSGLAMVKRFRPERAFLWVLGTLLLLAPVMHPEHALWILPFAALRLSVPWLAFTGLAFFAYAGRPLTPGAVDAFPLWAHLALWVPMAILLGVEARRLLRDRFPLPRPAQ